MRISDWSSDVCSADLKPQLRCLIPLTAWAEPAGIKGSKTRTWLSLKDRPIFAWGGLWRDSAEWGPVYSGAMTDANEVAAKVHNRMPVLLHEHEYDQWLHGSFDDLIAFQDRAFPSQLRSEERRVGKECVRTCRSRGWQDH